MGSPSPGDISPYSQQWHFLLEYPEDLSSWKSRDECHQSHLATAPPGLHSHSATVQNVRPPQDSRTPSSSLEVPQPGEAQRAVPRSGLHYTGYSACATAEHGVKAFSPMEQEDKAALLPTSRSHSGSKLPSNNDAAAGEESAVEIFFFRDDASPPFTRARTEEREQGSQGPRTQDPGICWRRHSWKESSSSGVPLERLPRAWPLLQDEAEQFNVLSLHDGAQLRNHEVLPMRDHEMPLMRDHEVLALRNHEVLPSRLQKSEINRRRQEAASRAEGCETMSCRLDAISMGTTDVTQKVHLSSSIPILPCAPITSRSEEIAAGVATSMPWYCYGVRRAAPCLLDVERIQADTEISEFGNGKEQLGPVSPLPRMLAKSASLSSPSSKSEISTQSSTLSISTLSTFSSYSSLTSPTLSISTLSSLTSPTGTESIDGEFSPGQTAPAGLLNTTQRKPPRHSRRKSLEVIPEISSQSSFVAKKPSICKSRSLSSALPSHLQDVGGSSLHQALPVAGSFSRSSASSRSDSSSPLISPKPILVREGSQSDQKGQMKRRVSFDETVDVFVYRNIHN